ncbi:DivIVA domain-containing protein [Streptomyces sp. NPDC014646]|uniref:DivIVA domain-containing protein n=1 Tax=unclassified Streptomyces TaxID=2593676 RepID=UPI0036FCC19A
MERRRGAGVVLGVLVVVTSVPVVSLIGDSLPVWALIFYLVAAALIGRTCYRLIWVDDLRDFEEPDDEVLTVEEIVQASREICLVRAFISEREFSGGRFSVGYRRSDVDAFFERLTSYLNATGPGVSVSWIRRKKFPWAMRETGYRQEEVDVLLRRVANDLESIIKSGRREKG